MNDVQKNRLNSLLKSDDFLDDQVDIVATVSQIVPLALQLKNTIASIYTAGGARELNLTGVAQDKATKRKNLIDQVLLLARAGKAYYMDTDAKKFKICNRMPSDLDKSDGNSVYMFAKEIEKLATADGANYIGYTNVTIVPQIELLKNRMEAFADVIQDPKREVETAATQNEQITPLINEGFAIREKIDVYMQTLIATQPALYSEWEKSLSIDDTGADTPVALSLEVTVPANQMIAVNYDAIELFANSEIKLTNDSPGDLQYGFGANNSTFAASQTVTSGNQKRLTANTLGFDALNNLVLNIQNTNNVPLTAKLEFYLM